MAVGTSIEWTEASWNPVTGCSKVSAGCAHCYAERMALRLQAIGHPNYVDGFQVRVHEHALTLPLRWRRPQMIFVNSMSDLFHEDVPLGFIQRVFDVMARAHWHQYQILTKRSLRLMELAPQLLWRPNIWMGVSVESQRYAFRVDHLRRTGAHIKFLSMEPLLGPMRQMNLDGIDWVIVGGESGPGARPMKREWVVEIRDQCLAAGVPFFFKQWGGTNKKKSGRELDGVTWEQWPNRASIAMPQSLPMPA